MLSCRLSEATANALSVLLTLLFLFLLLSSSLFFSFPMSSSLPLHPILHFPSFSPTCFSTPTLSLPLSPLSPFPFPLLLITNRRPRNNRECNATGYSVAMNADNVNRHAMGHSVDFCTAQPAMSTVRRPTVSGQCTLAYLFTDVSFITRDSML